MATMTYDEEAKIAQQVLDQLASEKAVLPTPASGTRGAQVDLSGVGYSVHRHGADLRFSQKTNLYHGEIGRYLIVSVGEHTGGWMVARAVRPPGGYHDERAAEAARRLVERKLSQLGYPVGTMGRAGRKKTAQELEADLREFLAQTANPGPAAARPARRRARRRAD